MVSEDEGATMKCADFGLPPCYDCLWYKSMSKIAKSLKPYKEEHCYLNRKSTQLKKWAIDQIKDDCVYHLKNYKYMPDGELERYEKAVKIHRPELFEWHLKMKTLM